MPAPAFTLSLLLVLCFGLACRLAPELHGREGSRARQGSFLAALLGDGRRLFANHFFIKADVYFHSGYYPTIFDNQEAHQTAHMAADAGVVEGNNPGGEGDFLGPPRDGLERLGPHFYVTTHTPLADPPPHPASHAPPP